MVEQQTAVITILPRVAACGLGQAAVLRAGLRAPSRAPAGGRCAPPDHPASRAGSVCDAGGACPGATRNSVGHRQSPLPVASD